MDPAQSEMDVSTAWVVCRVANSETKIFLTITPNNPTSDTTCGKVDRDWSSGKSGGYTRVPTVVTLIRGDKNQLFNCLFTLECNMYIYCLTLIVGDGNQLERRLEHICILNCQFGGQGASTK